MTEGVSESRFNMWRTVIALVHADHVVTEEERALAEGYLENVPFSEDQKSVLQQDLETAQDIDALFLSITEPDDQSEFFALARVMVWCDGDFDQQEEAIFDRLKDIQMGRIDPEALRAMVQNSKGVFNLERLKEDKEFEARADELVSVGRLVDALKKNITGEF